MVYNKLFQNIEMKHYIMYQDTELNAHCKKKLEDPYTTTCIERLEEILSKRE